MNIVPSGSSGASEDPQSERKTDACYRAIRKMIVHNDMAPGSFIDKTELCNRLSVSRQPVTAALSRLEHEGLVEILPQRGSYVARLSLLRLIEAVSIWAALEHFVASRMTDRMTPGVLAEMDRVNALAAEALGSRDDRVQVELDGAFHLALARASGQQRIAELVEMGIAAKTRATLVMARGSAQSGDVAEHGAIIEALRAGDGDKAAALASDHILGFTHDLKAFSKARPEIFIQ